MPLQQTSGNVTADAYGGGVAAVPNYIEDVFSTYLYTGNGTGQKITNNIDFSTYGGLLWMKPRSAGSTNNVLIDTVRNRTKLLYSNSTSAEVTSTGALSYFDVDGFYPWTDAATNANGTTFASWSFRKQPKFFDVVTYTGTQNSSGTGQTVSHNLGSTPGCIIIKPLSDTSGSGFTLNDWIVYHRALSSPTTQYLKLNTTAAIDGNSDKVKAVSATTFTAGWEVGLSGITYVAYVFAHNAGGFGLTGTDNVISCGSYVGNGSASGPVINLGYEPQWVLAKGSTDVSSWRIGDNMRGLVVGGDDSILIPNSSAAETTSTWMTPTATGFQIDGTSSAVNTSGSTYIYIAIRRGPMKVPTDATKVFSNNLETTSTNPQTLTTGFPVDLSISTLKTGSANRYAIDRLRGQSNALLADTTGSEFSSPGLNLQNNTALVDAGFWNTNGAIYWNFGRAPSFFDEVCYTGSGVFPLTLNHNLGVTPELIFVKRRNSARNWVGWQYQGTNGITGTGQFLNLNLTAAANASTTYNDGFVYGVSATQFAVGEFSSSNNVNSDCVAYLFASCPGVSKVGSYTGNGTTQTINCGFTGGARFVLIKRTDSTGDWYVYDTARGMTTLTDPYLLLNSTAAESATLGSVTTVSTGFAVNASILAAINTNGASYIFLAVA